MVGDGSKFLSTIASIAIVITIASIFVHTYRRSLKRLQQLAERGFRSIKPIDENLIPVVSEVLGRWRQPRRDAWYCENYRNTGRQSWYAETQIRRRGQECLGVFLIPISRAHTTLRTVKNNKTPFTRLKSLTTERDNDFLELPESEQHFLREFGFTLEATKIGPQPFDSNLAARLKEIQAPGILLGFGWSGEVLLVWGQYHQAGTVLTYADIIWDHLKSCSDQS